jgi:hypothetical protein
MTVIDRRNFLALVMGGGALAVSALAPMSMAAKAAVSAQSLMPPESDPVAENAQVVVVGPRRRRGRRRWRCWWRRGRRVCGWRW